MTNYRFILDKSSKKFPCPSCEQKRFVRYIDTMTDDYTDISFGRCDREQNCGYHLYPGNGRSRSYRHSKLNNERHQVASMDIIPREIFEESLTDYDKNNFTAYLRTLFSNETVEQLIQAYYIGTSKYWEGATIFWQVDRKGQIRTGRIFQFDPVTGKRAKDKNQWVHKIPDKKNYHLKQCYFGEHLLTSNKPIAMVESAKTAIIASVYLPEFIWLATDGSNGLMPQTHKKHEVLKGRKVTLYPDAGKLLEWSGKAELLKSICKINVSAIIEPHEQGCDIADYLTKLDVKVFRKNDCPNHACPCGVGTDEAIKLSPNGYPESWDEIEWPTD